MKLNEPTINANDHWLHFLVNTFPQDEFQIEYLQYLDSVEEDIQNYDVHFKKPVVQKIRIAIRQAGNNYPVLRRVAIMNSAFLSSKAETICENLPYSEVNACRLVEDLNHFFGEGVR
jgi:hypothetical protein